MRVPTPRALRFAWVGRRTRGHPRGAGQAPATPAPPGSPLARLLRSRSLTRPSTWALYRVAPNDPLSLFTAPRLFCQANIEPIRRNVRGPPQHAFRQADRGRQAPPARRRYRLDQGPGRAPYGADQLAHRPLPHPPQGPPRPAGAAQDGRYASPTPPVSPAQRPPALSRADRGARSPSLRPVGPRRRPERAQRVALAALVCSEPD